MKRDYQPQDPPRRLDIPVGGSGYVKVIDSWKTEMIDVLKSIRDELEKTRKVMEKGKNDEDDPVAYETGFRDGYRTGLKDKKIIDRAFT